MNRNERVRVAQETVEMIEQGFYTAPSGEIVNVGEPVECAKSGTVLYELDTMPAPPEPAFAAHAVLEVTGETTFAALRRLHEEGAESIGCLNFASAKNPGGGFLSGAQAQEEALARSSGLYPCLLSQPSYYERNRANRSTLYLDLAILSPSVPFFRNDDGCLLENPVLASVVTAPAPNAGAVMANEPSRVAEIPAVLRQRTEMVLRTFALAGVKTVVLGAWGCGVFRNSPQMVAETFAGYLKSGGAYACHFRKVVFAVFDPSGDRPNYKAFEAAFGF